MRTAWLLLGMALYLLPLSLLAQAPLTQEQKDRANALISQAESDFSAQNYEQALEGYKVVYDLVKDPELFYNIAQCYRLSTQIPEAVQYYQLYLQEATDSPYHQSAQEWLDKLTPLLPQESTSQALTPEPNDETFQIKPFLLPGCFLAGGVLLGTATLVIKQRAKEGDQPVSLKKAGLGVSISADLSFLLSGVTFVRAAKKHLQTPEGTQE